MIDGFDISRRRNAEMKIVMTRGMHNIPHKFSQFYNARIGNNEILKLNEDIYVRIVYMIIEILLKKNEIRTR